MLYLTTNYLQTRYYSVLAEIYRSSTFRNWKSIKIISYLSVALRNIHQLNLFTIPHQCTMAVGGQVFTYWYQLGSRKFSNYFAESRNITLIYRVIKGNLGKVWLYCSGNGAVLELKHMAKFHSGMDILIFGF